MTAITNLPNLRPSLLLDFANSGRVDPRITFSRASTATYFDNKGVLRTAPTGVPRIDYDPATGKCRGLLVEEKRTNLLFDSENLAAGDRGASTGWYSIIRGSVSANTSVAPDGLQTADKLVEDTSNGTHFISNRTPAGSTTNTSPLTASVFMKAAERSIGSVLLTEGTTFSRSVQAYFDLVAGTATTPVTAGGVTAASATITQVGGGWFRCSLTVTLGGADTRAELRVYPATSTTSASYQGNGTSGIYVWGAQLEKGSFPTSYIPTAASQVTRAADVCKIDGASFTSWYRQDEGTVLAEYRTASTGGAILSLDAGSASDRIAFEALSSTSSRARVC